VEISIALGVAAFCLLAILGLLQTGITSEQTTVGKTAAWGILSTVFSDLNSIPADQTTSKAYNISLSTTSPQTIYFTKAGKPTGGIGTAPTADSYYRMSVGIQGASATFATPRLTRLLVTWPAKADPVPGTWPQKASGSVEVITSLLRD
jgi:uncharacterized protein (TIGR02598 family)